MSTTNTDLDESIYTIFGKYKSDNYTPEQCKDMVLKIIESEKTKATNKAIETLDPFLNNKLDLEGQVKMSNVLAELQSKGEL